MAMVNKFTHTPSGAGFAICYQDIGEDMMPPDAQTDVQLIAGNVVFYDRLASNKDDNFLVQFFFCRARSVKVRSSCDTVPSMLMF